MLTTKTFIHQTITFLNRRCTWVLNSLSSDDSIPNDVGLLDPEDEAMLDAGVVRGTELVDTD